MKLITTYSTVVSGESIYFSEVMQEWCTNQPLIAHKVVIVSKDTLKEKFCKSQVIIRPFTPTFASSGVIHTQFHTWLAEQNKMLMLSTKSLRR